ncbi:hypothetical protein AYO45_05635 [Gammaproteobacteria bacterium SCGC AG-212-F23]|nr:hypothetical protein AYO45_05635 [Gammaproteobacteria bacterium SCGC AG-212-F23]
MTTAMQISPRSKSLITRSLRVLEKEGKITLRKEGRRLHITLSWSKLPLLGKISAGLPTEAIAQRQFLNIDKFLHGIGQFALQVKGYSMIDKGILDGDIVVCKRAATAREGTIVAVLIDSSDATLKIISYKTGEKITLIPANKELKPKHYAPERVQIQGIYAGLVRMNL